MAQKSQRESAVHKKKRRRTAYEIFFDEEPYFSDTADELEFEKNLTEHFALTDSTPPTKQAQTSYENKTITVKKLLEELTFCNTCLCCKKNKAFLDDLAPSTSNRSSPYSLSCDSGINVGNGSNNGQKIQNKEKNEATNILGDKNSPTKKSVKKKIRTKKRQKNVVAKNNSTKASRHQDINEQISIVNTREKENQNKQVTEQPSPLNVLLKEIEERRLNENRATRNSFPMSHEEDIKQTERKRPKRTQVDSKFKKSDCSFVDKKIFKIPVDTTNNRFIHEAILRKLGRACGGGPILESVNKQHEGFRSFQAQKVRKLYCPEDWINSKEFSRIEV